MFNPYVKAVLAMLLAISGALGTAYDDSILTTTEVVLTISAGFVAFTATWAFTSAPVKAAVAATVAGLASVAAAFQDDKFSLQEGVTTVGIVIAALMVVYKVPNADPVPPLARHR